MSEPLQVLAICTEDPEWILGGMGRHVREMYRAMAKRNDVEITLLTIGPKQGAMQFLGYEKHHDDKLIVWKPHHPGLAALYASDLQLAKTLLRLVGMGRRWDVVHCHEWPALQVARMARDSLDLPLVSTMHLCMARLREMDAGLDVDKPDDESQAWRKLALQLWPMMDHRLTEADTYMLAQEAKLLVESDELILCSKAYVRMVEKMFYRAPLTPRPIHMIYNGIDLDEWHPGAGDPKRARKAHKLETDKPVALYVGRVADMKGIRQVLDVAQHHDPGYLIVLAGEVNADTPEQREAWDVTQRIRWIEREHPDRLRWVGFQSGDALKDLYELADVILMPSLHEPFGIVALEAMAMGTPLVCTEVDGLGEIVTEGDAEYAMIVEPGSPESLAKGMEMLHDHELRDELRDLGLMRACMWSWDVVAEQTVAVYRQAIEWREKCQSS